MGAGEVCHFLDSDVPGAERHVLAGERSSFCGIGLILGAAVAGGKAKLRPTESFVRRGRVYRADNALIAVFTAIQRYGGLNGNIHLLDSQH